MHEGGNSKKLRKLERQTENNDRILTTGSWRS
jgi:hypothetical protein